MIFGSVFGGRSIEGGVKFTQYFVAGMIATGLFGCSFQTLAIPIPIERDSGALKRLRRHADAAVGVLRRQGRRWSPSSPRCRDVLLLAIGVLFYDLDLPSTAPAVADVSRG